ncbi:MAG TPA: GNAT family N-acetyltransferase [Solirubrobacteraceae bacterium]|nr:GNAT family N-acetyltransferase [Solirubrobacteraceae bacterium]
MSDEPRLRTERLLLRRWQPSDSEPFAAINADPAVMEFYPAALARADSDALIERIEDCFREHGYGLWAVEVAGERPLAGYAGLWPVEPELPFAPAVELGWRLARGRWGRGIATEAARACCELAFAQLGLEGLVAYTAAINARSRRVMERLGMTREPAEDFLHPGLPRGHRLGPHVLYRLEAG